LIQDYWMQENVIPKSTDSELPNKRKCSSQLVFLNFRVQADRWTCKHYILFSTWESELGFHLHYTKHIYIHWKMKYAQFISQLLPLRKACFIFHPYTLERLIHIWIGGAMKWHLQSYQILASITKILNMSTEDTTSVAPRDIWEISWLIQNLAYTESNKESSEIVWTGPCHKSWCWLVPSNQLDVLICTNLIRRHKKLKVVK
jgi:hypothetical protein